MTSFVCVIIFIFSLSFAECAFDLTENDQCSSELTGDKGICVEARKCEAFKIQRDNLKICAFRGKIPLVCCPRNNNLVKIGGISVKRISARKCDEYIQLAPEEETIYSITVVGGTKVLYNEFPFVSAIGWRRNNNKTDWLCGGSLISEKFVLSAAHCTLIGGKAPDVVRIGDLDLNVDEEGINPQEVFIKKIIVHPDYKHTIKYHDLALFELRTKVFFTKDVFPACLYQSTNDPIESIEAMGYGQTSFGGPQSNALLKSYLEIVDHDQCKTSYEDDKIELPQGIIQQQICAWDPDGNRDTCQGDSGGPLQVTKYTEDFQKYHEVLGVTSFGKFCAAGVPGVYVRVAAYLDWIESVVWPQIS